MSTSSPSKPSALVVEWQMRLEDLRAQQRLQPTHPKIWQWRMEEKVLVFMLARYGELAALNPLHSSPALYIAQGAFAVKFKERLSRLRRRQLLDDIEAKNWGKYGLRRDRKKDFYQEVDTYLQKQANYKREANKERKQFNEGKAFYKRRLW